MAFVTGTLLMIAANYGVRNFQVFGHRRGQLVLVLPNQSLDHQHPGASRRYLVLHARESRPYMIVPSPWASTYKMVDGLADVYEGRLRQRRTSFCVPGISQALRWMAVA